MNSNRFYQYLQNNYKKIIGWGTSGYYLKLSNEITVDLDYLIDSNDKKKGLVLNSKIIHTPDILEIENPEETLIVIFSSFYTEISERIKKFGDFYTISGHELLRLDLLLNRKNEELFNEDELNKKIIISISRNNYALNINGLSKFIGEQAELLEKSNYTPIHLFWRRYNLKNYKGIHFIVVKNGVESSICNLKELRNLLNKVKAVVVHSLATLELDILEQLIENLNLNVKLFYYIHDYASICSNINLMYNDEKFCKGYELNWSPCNTCTHKEKKEKIFTYHMNLFSNSNIHIIAPSNSTKSIIESSFNLSPDKVIVIPHQKYSIEKRKKYTNPEKKIRFAYLGYKHMNKGWEVFKEVVKEFNHKYDFYCFGSNDEIIEGVSYVEVSFNKDGELAMTKKLVEYEIDISFLWSITPETYSYTYFEGSAAGTFIITNKISGNIYDHVKKIRNGIALDNIQELYKLLSNEMNIRSMIQRNELIFNDLRKNEEGILRVLE